MLQKVLIANRGEIACRVMRTAEDLGIATVAVYSDADAQAMHVQMSDEAVHIGPAPATQSYLQIDKIIAAARDTGADCIHPGYGFLSENADFATACADAKITFIGPSPQAMRDMGGKANAKRIAIKAGVPVVPGYQDDDQSLATLQREAGSIGYPVMIKAVSGGGGRGMRLIHDEQEFADALDSAQREAEAAFGDRRMLLEKFVVRPRHIEVQIFGDRHGNIVHMFERDCTLQRRHQKVIEEAPAPGMPDALRNKITDAAVAIAKAVGYEGAGTVEFLVEGGNLTPDAPWYFIEMNTRLQVEHPVTEEITGLDLVEWQFRIAAGEKLPLQQNDIAFGGHAMEVRLCAEDPGHGFAPAIGKILEFDVLEDDGLRVETGVESGSEISPYYDSMIAKIIRVGLDRETVIDTLRMDLEDAEVIGVKTNLAFSHALLGDEHVRNGYVYTDLIAERLDTLTRSEPAVTAIAEGVRALLTERSLTSAQSQEGNSYDPFDSGDAFQLGGQRLMLQQFLVDGKPYTVELNWDLNHINITIGGSQNGAIKWDLATENVVSEDSHMPPSSILEQGTAYVLGDMKHITVSWPVHDLRMIDDNTAGNTVRAPINGRIVRLMVEAGAVVQTGDDIAVVEAMKMEHILPAPCAGRIAAIHVTEAEQVTEGTVIAEIEAEGAA